MLITILTVTSSALEITFTSPDSVHLNQEFEVSINADSTETHDVKIFVHNSEDQSIARSEYISEIFDDDWKDPWYYLKESFPDKKEYKIRVIESPDNGKICVRLRKTSTQTTSIECKPIEVKESSQSENTKQENNPDQYQTPDSEKSSEPSTPKENLENPQVQNPTTLSTLNNKILLNSQPGQSQEKEQTYTKQYNKRQVIIYSFLFFLVLIIILLALRKL